ncbi:hypothetical protein Tco_1431462 [Tanacetum coccineum]
MTFSLVMSLSSLRTPGLAPVHSFEAAETTMDSSGTLGLLLVPSFEPPKPGCLLLVFLLSFRACIMFVASYSAGVGDGAPLSFVFKVAASGSLEIMLSSADSVTLFLTTLLLAVFFLAGYGSGSDSSDTSTVLESHQQPSCPLNLFLCYSWVESDLLNI